MLRGIRSLLGESRHRNDGAKGDDEKNRFMLILPIPLRR
jgi:hypothetical protein